MSIELHQNTHIKCGGPIIFIPEDCGYLNGERALSISGCKIFMLNESIKNQICKTIYSVMLEGGTLSIQSDSVKIKNCKVYCSGNLEIYAKQLAEFCRIICGQNNFEVKK